MNNRKFLAARIASKVQVAVSAVAQVAEAVNNISGQMKPHNYVALGTIAMGRLTSFLAFDPDEDTTLVEPVGIPYEVRDFLKKITSRYPTQKIPADRGDIVSVTTLYNSTIIFKGSGWQAELWIKVQPGQSAEECEKQAFEDLGRAVWETLGTSVEMVSGKEKSLITLQPWDLGTILSSEQTRQVTERTKKLLALGGPRSLMLHGPPGTGKTCMARSIASNISGTSLSITAKYLKDVDSCTLTFVLDLLSPDSLLIDDIDRVDDVAALLPAIDRIRPKTKLIMVTVNHLDEVDAAVKRAGRFDDLVEVIRVKAPSEMIPDLPEWAGKEIDNWPIAYVTELKARLAALGKDCLKKEMGALSVRVESNTDEKDDKE